MNVLDNTARSMARRATVRLLAGALAGGLSTLTACAWWMAGRPESRPRDEIKISHKLHDEAGASCADCHGEVAASTDLSASFAPKEEACMSCHERDECSMCHTQVDLRTARLPHEESLGFSHASHMERIGKLGDAGKGCETCHTDAKTAEAGALARVPMSTCLTCHEHATDYAEARCQHCHPALRQLPLVAVAEFEHGGDWLERHGMFARAQGDTCQQCHTQATCTDCHARKALAAPASLFPEQVGRQLLHRGDFATSHSIDARVAGDTCLRCHATATCHDCHTAVGLTGEGVNPTNPHPPGYGVRGGGAAFHGDEARARIETCAACHDQGAASNCVDCHKVGGVGGNPHPRGWAQRHSDPSEGPSCVACH